MKFAAIVLMSAIAILSCGPQAFQSETELDPVTASTEQLTVTTLGLTSISSAETYDAMSIEGGGFGQAGRLMKFFVDARVPSQKKVHFINGNFEVGGKTPDAAKYHFDFAKRQLQIPESGTEFNDVTYFAERKRYFAGTIQTYQLGEQPLLYAIGLYPDDVARESEILALAQAIKKAFTIRGARLAFIASGPQQTFATISNDMRVSGFEVLSIDQVLGAVKYLPLNPGEAWGYLRIFPADQGDVRPTDILVFDELPLDLSVCAATVTRVFQDVTSHVNLKSKERGTPNMVLRDASPTNAQLAPFKDKPVHLVVGKAGFNVEATTAEVVEQKLRERLSKPTQQLTVTNEPNLVWYDDMCKTLSSACTNNGPRFGGKAANLGFLANRDVLGRSTQAGSQSAKAG